MQNIMNIKKRIAALVGETVELESDHGRNKLVKKEGKIVNAYPGVFTVEVYLNNEDQSIISYSYSDVLCERVKIMGL